MDIGIANDLGHLWEWPVGLHFVLSALVGGLLGIGGLSHLLNKKSVARVAIFISLPLLALDLLALWLDLTRMWRVFWLFLNFRVTAAISWGSWSLLLAGVVTLLYIAAYIGFIRPSERTMDGFAWALIVLSIAVTSYTGAMLSTSMAARPLWSSMLLAPLFFASAIAMGAGLLEIFNTGEKVPSWILGISTVGGAILLGFYIGELYAGTLAVQEAFNTLTKNYRLIWWITVGLGFGLPSFASFWWMFSQKRRIWGLTKGIALLSLFGGTSIRFVLLMAGQVH
ncbi:MAG: NrfD/PsrC family molybdoenzyme membrane anchor subunit [Candidatus Bipolaricaulota bacterium]